MKIFIIAYNEALDEELLDILDKTQSGFTRWKRVQGRGQASGYHLGDNIWPGFVNVVMVGCADENVGLFKEELHRLKKQFLHEGVKAFMLPVEDVI